MNFLRQTLLSSLCVLIINFNVVVVEGGRGVKSQYSMSSSSVNRYKKKQPHRYSSSSSSYGSITGGTGQIGADGIITPSMSLLHNIFSNYAKEVMPERPVIVSMDVLLFKVKSTIEKEGVFESVIGLVIEWHDKRMKWNSSEYENITVLAIDADKVWLPDIAMTNAADHPYQISRDNRFVVRVNNCGQMRFVPSGTARTWCRIRLTTFPFDFQTCYLEFESWSMDMATMTFDGKSQLIIDSSFDSTQFYLCNYTATTYYHTYDFSNETFTRIRIAVTVRRKTMFHVINLIFPCVVLSAIQLLVFILSSVNTTVDRIGFATTNMLTMVVFQTIVTEEMPKTSDAVTALSKYITALILISAVGILESVVVERLLEIKRKPPPLVLIRFVKCFPVILREHWGELLEEALEINVEENDAEDGENKREKHVRISKSEDNLMNRTVVPRGSVDYGIDSSSEVCDVPVIRSPSYSQAMLNRMIPSPRLSTATVTLHQPQLLKARRKPSLKRHTLAESEEMRAIHDQFSATIERERREEHNANLWREVVFRIDFLAFVSCASFVVLIPCGLFLPLVVFHPLCDNLEEYYENSNQIPNP